MATPPIHEPDERSPGIPRRSPPVAPPTPVPGQAPPGQGLTRFVWFILISIAMIVLSPPTMLLLFGLLPTVVAGIVDRTEGKYATFCVFGMNFLGIFPYLADIWFQEHTIDAAINILTDPLDLMIIYGAAGFGWMIYIAVPPVIVTFISAMSQRRVTTLRDNQRKIIEEWGENVATALETVGQENAAQAGAAPPAQAGPPPAIGLRDGSPAPPPGIKKG